MGDAVEREGGSGELIAEENGVADDEVLSGRAKPGGLGSLSQELGEELQRIVAEVSQALRHRLLQLRQGAVFEIFGRGFGEAGELRRGEEPFPVREELVDRRGVVRGSGEELEVFEVEGGGELIGGRVRVGFGGSGDQDDQ